MLFILFFKDSATPEIYTSVHPRALHDSLPIYWFVTRCDGLDARAIPSPALSRYVEVSPQRPFLYSFRRCPYAIRARLALLVSRQAVELREVVLRDKPAALREASPKATVPVLILSDGQVVDQSLDIMHWALDRSDPESWMTPQDAALIAVNDGPFKHHLDRTKYPERYGCDPAPHRAAALHLLHALDARLRLSAQLCGATRGLTDMAIFPFVRQFAATD